MEVTEKRRSSAMVLTVFCSFVTCVLIDAASESTRRLCSWQLRRHKVVFGGGEGERERDRRRTREYWMRLRQRMNHFAIVLYFCPEVKFVQK